MTQEYTPEMGDVEWVERAACANMRVDVFFVEAGRVIDPAVLAICEGCPVRRECLTYAYEREFTSGYFGGFSPGQRKDLTLAEALAAIDAPDAAPAH